MTDRGNYTLGKRAPHWRKDGLTSLVNESGKIRWWCSLCDGRRGKGRRQTAVSVEAMFVAWDQHRATERHQERWSRERLVDGLFTKLFGEESADDA